MHIIFDNKKYFKYGKLEYVKGSYTSLTMLFMFSFIMWEIFLRCSSYVSVNEDRVLLVVCKDDLISKFVL